MKLRIPFYTLILFALFISSIHPQDEAKKEEKKDRHIFTMIHEIGTTSVKNQAKTGTCWDFATQSFLESELMRMGKGKYNLSEMFNVRYTYPLKAERYVRYHGKYQFGEGGQAHDVLKIFDTYGAVPNSVYSGLEPGDSLYDNTEMDDVLKAVLETIVKRNRISDHYEDLVNAICDVYLGKVPQEFEYNGKKYTPKSFAESLGINTKDYVEITSFTHHPFYSKFVLEVPDNWEEGEYYNVPLDDLIQIMNNAIANDYSVAWDGAVGKNNFYRKEGYAVVPIDGDTATTGAEKELDVTQQMRQKAFDDYATTDDHLMQITGVAKDQAGTTFYYTKNSWGTKDKKYDGYWYMSEPFVKLRTIAIMVNKNAIPKDIRDKLGI
ncbi:MAG: C1 family peptidase [Ignavibacteriaceae bacterium]